MDESDDFPSELSYANAAVRHNSDLIFHHLVVIALLSGLATRNEVEHAG
jgi:hypothetical protein